MTLSSSEKHIKDIRRNTCRKFSSEEKIRILLDGLRGECSIAELCRREWLRKQKIEHSRGAPYHPMTRGKIERYHRSMKNVVKLEHYYFPWEPEKAIEEWVTHYNHERYHESLDREVYGRS